LRRGRRGSSQRSGDHLQVRVARDDAIDHASKFVGSRAERFRVDALDREAQAAVKILLVAEHDVD